MATTPQTKTLTPVKMRTGDGVHAALGIALDPGRRTDGVGGLLLQQRLIAVEHIQAAQTFLKLCRQLGGGQLHKGVRA